MYVHINIGVGGAAGYCISVFVTVLSSGLSEKLHRLKRKGFYLLTHR